MRSLSAKALLAKAEPPKPLDVERTIQSILRGDTKEGFSSVVSITCSNHTYLSQWKSIEWSLATFKGVVEVVRRYEVDELKYDGRSAWILFMMLEYGTQTRSWEYFEEDHDLINTMIATLLRILVEHSNYNQIFLTFRTLMNSYNLNGSQLFQIGCALLEQLPATIKDENFVALLDLAVVCIEKDNTCLAPTLKMLNYCSNFVICDWKSNFFLDQKVNTLTKAFDYYPSITDDRLRTEVLFDTIQLMRRLATMNEKNAEHISGHAAVMSHFLTLLNTEASPVTPAHLHREILATLNILTRIPRGSKTVGRLLSIADLRRLITVCDDALATEAIVDLFFNLYEAGLEYWDDAFHYMIQRNTACEAFIVDILEQAIRILTADFPESPSTPTSTGGHGRDAMAASLIGLRLDAVARIFFRLERSVLILSDAQSFLVQKTALLRVCQRILGDDPAKFVLRHHSVIDIVCFILRGTHRCWLPATFDPLDEDFIYVSSALVDQFLSVTRKKIFDHKDADSLHYLAGADTYSPIQTMIAKSSEDQVFVEQVNMRRKKSRGNSSLGVDTTLEAPTTTSTTTAAETSTNNGDGDDDEGTKVRQAFLVTVEHLLQTIVGRISWLRRSVTFWELDASDVAARRVCYTLLLLRLFGCPALNDVLPDFDALRSVLFQLLVDPSLSLSSFVGIESKCLQVLSLLCLHQGGFDQSLQCYEYLTKIILTNPEMLSERRRSEYQRDQISMDGGSLSPLPGGGPRSGSGSGSGVGLLGFSPPRESLLYGHSLSTTTGGGSGQTQAMHIALETGNLLGVQLQLLYDAVNTLLVLSEVDRSVRRKLVASCSGLLDCLGYYTPVDPIMQRPVLHLIASFIEFAPKFEVDAEEAIVGILIRTLNSPLHYIRYQSCNLIYHIGLESPGFVFRGLSRREVEDPVMDIISHSPFEYPRLIVSAIKAAATLVHNFNIKPVWIPSSILYHWRCYQPHLAQRPFLGVKGLALVVNLLQHAQVPYRLLYFTYTLSLSASLMYACSELTGNPNPDDMRALQELKDYLIENILPWLPLAIDFISLGKRKRRFDLLPAAEVATADAAASAASSSSSSTAAGAASAPSSTKVAPSSSRKAATKETTITTTAAAAASSSSPTSSSSSSSSSPPSPSATAAAAASVQALVPPITTLDASIQSILNRLYTLAALPSSCTRSTEEHFQLFHAQQYNLWSYFSVSFSMEGYDDSSSVNGTLSAIGAIRLLTPTERETLFPDVHVDTTPATAAGAASTAVAGPAADVSEQSEHSTDEVLQSMTTATTATARGVPPLPPHRPLTGVSRLRRTPHSVYRSKSMEFLTVKTIDALYAFLCMDDMYPLSTYLRYTHLFEQCQVIASVSYFMSEHFENPLVLKRGLDLLRYFADHQMQLSSIAMHSPPALIAVVRNMQDSVEVLLSFAKIILAINRTDDDFARENLMRFRVHQVLLELVLRESNAELVRICIQALLALAASDMHVREIARVELPAFLAPTSKPSYGSKEPPVVLVGTGPIAPAASSVSDFASYTDEGIAAANATTTAAATTTTTTGAGSSSAKSIRRGSHQPPSSSSSPPHPPRGSPEATAKRSRAHSHGSEDGGPQQPYHQAARAGSTTPFAMIPKPSSASSSPSSLTTTPPANGSSKKSLGGLSAAGGTPSAFASQQQPQTINLIDVLLYVVETQGKELRTQYYALRLLVLVENQYKAAVHQVLRRSPLANALKKSKKALKKTYIDDAIAAAQAAGGGGDAALVTGHANGSGRVMSRGVSTDNSAAMGKGEEIERRDVEQLLNEPIIKNDRCVIS